MLKIKANINNTIAKSERIRFTGAAVSLSEDNIYQITFTTYGFHNLSEGQRINFRRIDGSNIDFTNELKVHIIDKTHFSVNIEKYRQLYFSKVGKSVIKEKTGEEEELAISIQTRSGYPHNFVKNRDNVILYETISGDELPTNTCESYYFLYNYTFLYRGVDFEDNQNISNIIYCQNGDETTELTVMVPYMSSNNDNKNTLIIKDFTEDIDTLIDMLINGRITCIDEMFFTVNEGVINFQDGFFIEKTISVINASLGFLEDYSYDITDIIENSNIDEQITLNEAVDYEKQIFYPCAYGTTDLLEKIVFKLHFRDRYYSDKLSETWDTSDEKYWMRYNKVENGRLKPSGEVTTDNMSDLGYTDDDIKYQRNNFTKSFIRLLFYDTNDTRTQSLLAYYSVPFNSDQMFSEVTSKGKHTNDIEPAIEVYGEENGFAGTEGYNLHLFPNILEGKEEEFIYLRIEFNHAKYGKTLKMSFPTDSDGNLILFDNEDFPITYYNDFDKRVELERLMNDMYIKVGLKYDYKNNRYLWYPAIDNISENGIITINAIEPRVNP